MTLDKFKRVLWRLQEMQPAEYGAYNYKQLRLAIMEEIGTDDRTIDETLRKMLELKLLARAQLGHMKVTA